MTAAQQRKLAPLVVLGGHHQTFLASKIAGAALNSWKDDPGHPWNFENKWPYMAQLAFQRQVFFTILGCQCAKENTFIMLSLIASLVLLWLRCRQGKMRPALPCGHPVGHPLKPKKENKYNRMDTNTLPWKPHGPPPQILCDHHGLACCQTCDPSPCWEADCTAGQLTCSWKTWARGSSCHTCHQAEAPICKSNPNSMSRPWMWLPKGAEEACDALPRRASLRANMTTQKLLVTMTDWGRDSPTTAARHSRSKCEGQQSKRQRSNLQNCKATTKNRIETQPWRSKSWKQSVTSELDPGVQGVTDQNVIRHSCLKLSKHVTAKKS